MRAFADVLLRLPIMWLLESMMMIMSLIMPPMLVRVTMMVMLITTMMDLRVAMIMKVVTAMLDELTLEPVPAGRCAVCGAPLPTLAVADRDAYCSSTCCRIAHQVPLGPGLRTAWPDGVMALLRKEDEHVDP